MRDLRRNLIISNFSHIYVEKDAQNHPNTKRIISHFKKANIIEIDHYKDVFSRGNQNFMLQKESMKLILAIKRDNLIYKGSEMCEDFGNQNFYYTSSIMNCMYHCEYCYLQGMYPSANVVIFVNIEDIFKELEKLLSKHPVYLAISYDSDLLAFENITSFTSMWLDFASKHNDLKIEIRTKSGNFNSVKHLQPLENVILAWTMSPDTVIDLYEKRTPSLNLRLKSALDALNMDWKVRLCFDPLLYIKDWKKHYGEFIDKVFRVLPPENIYDISIGMFRISKGYLKKMQKENPYSTLLAYPFECIDGVCSYSQKHIEEITNFVYEKTLKYVHDNKIYSKGLY